MKKITYSAPAKVILSGEHAVVYGNPGLIAAIDRRLIFTVLPSRKKTTQTNILWAEKIIKDYFSNHKIKYQNKNFTCEIQSTIPLGRGLGSSAAFSVAAIAALLDFFTGRQWEKNTIYELAYQLEKKFHHNSSGVDPAASCYGGLLFYRKELDCLKVILPLPFILPTKISRTLYLVDSGKPEETTGEMVKLVSRQKLPLLAMEKVTKQMIQAIKDANLRLFQQAVHHNAVLLEQISAVAEKTKKLQESWKNFAVSKITGASGYKLFSGYILVSTKQPERLKTYCRNNCLPIIKLAAINSGLEKIL